MAPWKAKWTDAIMLQFLDLYEKHQCLWNQKHEIYRNKEARESAIQNILYEMQLFPMSSVDIKNKIKSIRTMYKKELTLILKSSTNGAENIYVPKLVWFERADTFLRSVTRNSSSNSIMSHDEDELTEYDNIDLVDATLIETIPPSAEDTSSNQEELTLETEVQSSTTVPNHKLPSNSKSHRLVRKKGSQECGTLNQRKRSLAAINETINRLNAIGNPANNDDEFECFGKLIAAQLRKMPEYDAILCEEKISAVISQQRLHILEVALRQSSPDHSHRSIPSPLGFYNIKPLDPKHGGLY